MPELPLVQNVFPGGADASTHTPSSAAPSGPVGLANCATCNPPTTAAGRNHNAATCTACDGDNYLKTDENSQATSCVTAQNCGDGFSATTVKGIKRCVSCSNTGKGGIADCKTCLKSGETVTCSACTTPTKKPNADGTKCVDCAAAGCAKCSDEGVCVECSTGKYLTPTAQCVDDCGKLGATTKIITIYASHAAPSAPRASVPVLISAPPVPRGRPSNTPVRVT